MKRKRKKVLGSWQTGIYHSLVDGMTVHNPVATLRGKAREYQSRYRESFLSVLEHLEKQGYVIQRTPGPHGGEWSASYRAEHRNPLIAQARLTCRPSKEHSA